MCMAKTTYLTISPADEAAFFKNLKPQDRFIRARLTKNKTLFSRDAKIKLTQKSLLPQLAEIWNAFSVDEKNAWGAAGEYADIWTGWRMFVQDQCARIKNGLAGVATPDNLHQSWVGALKIADPATEIKLVQLHPQFYWVNQAVPGKKGMTQPVQVTEFFSLPLQLKLNYSADLVSQGAGSFAKFYAVVWSLYQGLDILTNLEIDLDLSTAWKSADATLSSVLGLPIRYDLYFHLYNVRGMLYIDNLEANHNYQNWVRDLHCKSIDTTFTGAFYQIPKHWAPVELPDGAEYESIYKDF